MRKLKKLVALTMCTVMMMSSSAYAVTVLQTDSFKTGDSWITEDKNEYDIPTSFSSKWSNNVQWEFKDERGCVYDACMATVGYDTWWTKEDYMKSVGGVATYKVRGRIKNSSGEYSSYTPWRRSVLSGKVDVKHTGGSVIYYLQLGS